MEKKVSIVVPCYGTEKYVGRCVESLINQTYRNLEIILVNDASPDDMDKILNGFAKKDKRIVVVTNKKNKGLFHARLAGADRSTGDYICFVDSDDYVSIDYIRSLVFDIERKGADMVFSNVVIDERGNKSIYTLFDFHTDEISGDEALRGYFAQKGLNYVWHIIWNKMYRIDLWKKARPYYDMLEKHLVMTEDFAFSTVLFSFCKKIIFNKYANIYYCSNDESSTSLAKASVEKYKKNINDIFTSFCFVEEFLKKRKLYSQYKDDFLFWRDVYLKIWYGHITTSKLSKSDKNKLLDLLYEKNSEISNFDYKNLTNFYSSRTAFNDRYEQLIKMIIDADVVSFDIFDTLVVRPFYQPKDLFRLLNKKYRQLCPDSSLVFSSVREEAEKLCRDHVFESDFYEEVTLDEIYNYISDNYKIKNDVLVALKREEVDLELKYCVARESGKNLYNIARYLNKRIIIVSDIYLSRMVIEEILRKNGYDCIGRIYLSCEERLSKATGQLYKIVTTQEGVDKKIVHFGDNIASDYHNPKRFRINAGHLPKATDIFLAFSNRIFGTTGGEIDLNNVLSFSGVRSSLAMVANKFFDNPFISFEATSDFNCDPAYVGYFALGMHTFAVTKWIYDDLKRNKYDSIAFMARDGYLINQEFNLFQNYSKLDIKTGYLPISRKSLLPFSFTKREDLSNLLSYFNYDKVSPAVLYETIGDILKRPLENNEECFKTYEEFATFVNFEIIPNIDEEKLAYRREKLKEYYLEFFEGKAAAFDIGYSAKPENTITRLLGKPIDSYFIHINDENGYYYPNSAGFRLNTFYDFKPKFTGLLREYVLSQLSGSCKKYRISNKVEVVYEDIEIDYYEKWILDLMQKNALEFTGDCLRLFSDYLSELSFPNYYMSVAFEYFMHNVSWFDKKMFDNLLFENAINDYININDVWSNEGSEAQKHIPSAKRGEREYYDLRISNKNIFTKTVYCSLFDRPLLREKASKKLNKDSFMGKATRKIYRTVRRKK